MHDAFSMCTRVHTSDLIMSGTTRELKCEVLIMTSVLIGRSMCQRMTIMVLITGASMRHQMNAEGRGEQMSF